LVISDANTTPYFWLYDMVFLQHNYQTAVQTMNIKFVLYYNL